MVWNLHMKWYENSQSYVCIKTMSSIFLKFWSGYSRNELHDYNVKAVATGEGPPPLNFFSPPPPPLIWGSGSTTGTCLILRFVENENTRQQLSFSFAELWYSSLEFNSKEKYPHLTNETRWNKRDKVWGSANSFLKVDFHCLVIFTCVHTWILRA